MAVGGASSSSKGGGPSSSSGVGSASRGSGSASASSKGASASSKGASANTTGGTPGTGTDTKASTTDSTSKASKDKSVSTSDIDKANSPETQAEEESGKQKSEAFSAAISEMDEAQTEADKAVEKAQTAAPEDQEAALAEARSKVDGLKVASDKVQGATETGAVAKGVQTPARMSTSGLHATSAVLGAVDLFNNGSNMSTAQQVATGTGIAADLNSTVASLPGNKATSGLLGSVNKFAGPMGVVAKTTEGASSMVNGETQADRVKGATMTAVGLGTLQTAGAAGLAGASKLALGATGFGGALITGVEGVHQLATADTTQGMIAGGLKTGAAAAFAAAAIPGPHSIPVAVAGAGMYAGGVVADNWDTVTEYGGKAIDAVTDTAGDVAGWAGDVASDAYDGVSSRVGALASGIAGWFN